MIGTFMGKRGWWTFHLFWFMKPKYVFSDSLDKLRQDIPIQVQSVDDILPTLRTGDLIFDVGYNTKGIYVGLKWGSSSIVTHTGFIHVIDGTPWVLEAVLEGVRYIPVREALKIYSADIIFIRRLEGDPGKIDEKIIYNFAAKHFDEVHKAKSLSGAWEMIKAAIDPKLPLSGKDFLRNHRQPGSMFCSELVADLYMKLGIIPDDIEDDYPDSNEYIPPDFTTFCTKRGQEYEILNDLPNGFKLSEEVFIQFDRNELIKEDQSIYWITT
ncbi:MAG: hypothetical protein INQ03_01530 [Candidatus Heimdallarchaeota archaeon]|nr:hypothetical protein [Candidatus Heimdallarchaeota archaeon]